MGSLPIVEVVVHRDGALVHRRGRLPIVGGQLVVTGLPLVLQEASLRVEIVGATPSGWRLAIDVDGLDRGGEPAVDRALYEARAEVARLEARDHALAATRAIVFRSLPGAPIREEEPTAERMLAWSGLSAGLVAWAAELDEGRIALVETLERAREQLRVAEHRASQVSSEDRYRFWAPANRLAIAVDGADEVEVVVSYRVDAAAWVPTYALFADAALRTARFLARALVAQATGEDWRGVRLAFSTAPSARSLDVPELPALRLGKAQAAVPSPWRDLPADLDSLFPSELHALADASPAEEPAPEEASSAIAAVRAKVLAPPAPSPAPMPPGAPMPQSAPMSRAMAVAAPAPMARPAPKAGGGLLAGLGAGVGSVMGALGEMADDLGGSAASTPARHRGGASGLGPLEVNPDLLDYGSLRLGRLDASVERRGRLGPVDPLAELRLPPAGVAIVRRARSLQGGAHDRLRFDTLPAHHVMPGPIDEADHRYEASGEADVPSDGRFHAVSLFQDDLALDVRYRSVPRSDPRAFRTVRARLTRPVPLLAGPVDVHIDGALVLVAAWAGSAKGGEVVIGLGPEDGIKIARNVRYREESAGLMGGYRRLHTEVEVDVASSLGRAAEIELLDRLPITDDPEITIELVAASPSADAYKGDDGGGPILRGGRRQVVAVPPGGKTRATLHYSVVLGSKLEIDGGERR